MKKILPILLLLSLYACTTEQAKPVQTASDNVFMVVLGIAQDAGYPQAACTKVCCKDLWNNTAHRRQVTCLGLVDKEAEKVWLLEATPDIKFQMEQLAACLPSRETHLPDGILLTHAHIGHYTGLMHLGREAIGAKEVPVFAMPRMKNFLQTQEPWAQLVRLKNIAIQNLQADSTLVLSKNLKITPFLVPHRDELSETVGYRIEGPSKKGLFIPDIDKWNKWERSIKKEIQEVDFAYLDGTFFKNGEIPNRDMSLIPHPFIEESVALFDDLAMEEKKKITFIHFNHTNPALNPKSAERLELLAKGYRLAEEGERQGL